MKTMEDKNALGLREIILEKSSAPTWDQARREWRVRRVTFAGPIGKCLCGEDRMTCVCELFNETRRTLLEVDACCVTFVVGEYWEAMCESLARVNRDIARPLIPPVIDYASTLEWINKWETKFYHDTLRFRSLSKKQLSKREDINGRVLQRFASGV